MAAGASSRMKKSLDQVNLSSEVREVAYSQHKSMIPIDKSGKSLLFYLCANAKKAGKPSSKNLIHSATTDEIVFICKMISQYKCNIIRRDIQ